MPSVLLVYATTHGQTARIARRIAARLGERGLDVDLADLGAAPDPDPSGYDVVVVGASVHAGHHQGAVHDWVRKNRWAIASRPSALFSLSLMAADDDAESQEVVRGYVDDLLEGTGWMPDRTASLAGALRYREYDPFTRFLMRAIVRRHGGSTDTSRDHEYTDWGAVTAFADDVAALLGAPATPAAAT